MLQHLILLRDSLPLWSYISSLLFNAALIVMSTLLVRLLGPSVSKFGNATWKRTMSVTVFRYGMDRLPTNFQLRFLLGTSFQTYQKWTKKKGLPVVIDELEQNASLFWIGSKKNRPCYPLSAWFFGLS